MAQEKMYNEDKLKVRLKMWLYHVPFLLEEMNFYKILNLLNIFPYEQF